MSCSKEITNFMIRCQNRHGFPLPAIYSRFVGQGTDIDTINEILKVNDFNMIRGAMNPIKYFLTFLIDLKPEIENVLGRGYRVNVFRSINYMKEWSYYEHSFQFCKCSNDLFRVPVNNWSVAVDITNFEDRKVSSIDIYCLWDRIYEGISKKIMNSYKDFTKETFPRVVSSIFFFGDNTDTFCADVFIIYCNLF